MERWLQQVADGLDVDVEVPVDALLDAARVVAHSVERRATPLTTYLIGVAVGTGGDARELSRRVREMAERWAETELDADGRSR